MNELLNKMSSQAIYGTMVAIVVIVCLAAYLYVFKKPWQEYELLKTNTRLLEARVEGGSGISRELAAMQDEVESLTRHLQGQTPPLSSSKMMARVINVLDIISAKHAVQFLGLKPAVPGTVKYFEELPFAIEVSGNYFSLFDWLQEVEGELGPMVIKKIDIETPGASEAQIMRLNMVSYRLK